METLKTLTKHLRKRAGITGARFLLWLGAHGTPERNRKTARVLGRMVFPFLRRERKKAEDTLSRARLPIRIKDRRAFLMRVFENFGKAALDTAMLLGGHPGNPEALVEPESLEHFRRTALDLYSRDRRLILLSCHLGNWEILGGISGRILPRVASVAKRVAHPEYQELVSRLRAGLGSLVFYQDEPLLKMVRFLKEGGVLGLLPDQDIRHNAGIFVPFFGTDAYTPVGPAAISILAQAPILPVFMPHHGNGYRIVSLPPIFPPPHRNENAIRELTSAWQRAVEKIITAYPDQWAWFHPRYKTRPEDIASVQPPGEGASP